MLTSLITLLPLLALLAPTLALDNNAMRSKSVYQLVTDRFALPNNATTACDTGSRKYCGGTWASIVEHLDYIKGMGFDTVWISPVVENIDGETPIGEAYHGYWTQNPDNLNSKFGTADDLKALAQALHDRNMYLQVDVVINHVASTAGQSFSPNSSYGQLSSSDSYHPFCWVQNYDNQTEVEDCWLGDSQVALPDINTESQSVIDYWNNWIKKLISDYSIDTIRIDTVKHVPHTFWSQFIQNVDVFNQGEVLFDDPAYIGSYQTNSSLNPFNYPMYYPITYTFNSTSFSMDQILQMHEQIKGNFSDPTLLGNFLNNHDNPRFESFQKDKALIKNAHAFPLVTDGIPYVYYGSEAGYEGGSDPYNREALWSSKFDTSQDMYRFFTVLNSARAAAGAANSSFYTNQMNLVGLTANELIVSKPPLISLLSNRGSQSTSDDLFISVNHTGWAPQTTILDAVSCNTFTTDGNGNLVTTIENGLPRVFIADAQKGQTCDATLFTNNSISGSGSGSGGNSGSGGGNGGFKLGGSVMLTSIAGLAAAAVGYLL